MQPTNRRLRCVALIWAAVFFTVGLGFLLLPGQVAAGLEALAAVAGLPGRIPTGSGSLWHVLTCSLMMTITVLALQVALRPDAPGPYGSLLVAKLTSTVGFLALATSAPAWILCAVGDAFVALTLWYARRSGDRDPRRPDFVARYLTDLGASRDGLGAYQRRAGALPVLVRLSLRVCRWFFTWPAPFLLDGQWRTAGRLDDGAFRRLCERARLHWLQPVRWAWLLVNQPAAGVICDARVPRDHD